MIHLLLILFFVVSGEDSIELNNKAVKLLEKDQYDQAIRLLVTALNLDPKSQPIADNLAAAHAQRGIEAGKRGNLYSAVQDMRAASRYASEKARYRYYEAHFLYRMGELLPAEDVVNRALKAAHPPELDAKMIHLKGNILYLDDRLEAALAAFEEALKADPQGRDSARMKAKVERELKIQKEYHQDSTTYFNLLYDREGLELNRQGPFVCLLEEERTKVCSDFSHFPRKRTTVIVYNPSDFKTVTEAEAWVGGIFDRKIRIPLSNVNKDLEHIAHVVRHEYSHVILFDLAPGCPAWINEGLASYEEYGPGTGEKRMLAMMAKGVKPLPFNDLPSSFFQTTDPHRVRLYYTQSHAMMEYLIEHHGWGKVRLLLRELKKLSGDWEIAFRSTFSRDFKSMEKAWLTSLDR